MLQHWLNKNTHDRLNGNNTTDVKEERDSTKNMILLAMLRLLQKERNGEKEERTKMIEVHYCGPVK